jgi:multiple sugar transport system substrate-binding protein
VSSGLRGSPDVEAKPTTIVFARESSYVKNFDEHFQKVLIPAYQKATGIKIDYQIQAAGGSAVPQIVSMVENKSGADLAWVQQEWLYRDALVDVSDIAEAVGKEQGGWYDEIALSVDNGKWKSVPQANIGQLMVYRRTGSTRPGSSNFLIPGTSSGSRHQAQGKGHPFGMSMGHGFADNYPGSPGLVPRRHRHGQGRQEGRADSSETVKAVEYVKRPTRKPASRTASAG